MSDFANEYILLCAVIYLAYRAGLILLEIVYSRWVIAPQINELVKQQLDKFIHDVTTEVRSGVEYWYERESGQFIAQGRTQEEIVSVLKAVWPGHVFLVNEQHLLSAPNYTPIPVDQLFNKK
jgi:hypothetical protein